MMPRRGAVRATAPVLPEPPTPNIEAYQLYLQGRALALSGRPEGIRAGIGFLERAIAIDPNFARAYSYLSIAQTDLVLFGTAKSALLADAERNAKRALTLDAELAEGYASLIT
jgi:hypothetical protein